LRSEYFIKTIENKKKAVSKINNLVEDTLAIYLNIDQGCVLVIELILVTLKLNDYSSDHVEIRKYHYPHRPSLKIFEDGSYLSDAAREHRVSLIKQVGKQFRRIS
jgi:hypothetical protein